MTSFGIIGSSQDALFLCQEMQKMGIWVNSLTRHNTAKVHQLADSRYTARDIQSIINFATDSDCVFIVDRELQTSVLKELENLTFFAQSLELYQKIGHGQELKDRLTALSDTSYQSTKVQANLTLTCLPDGEQVHILAISHNHYLKDQLKESLVQNTHDLYENLQKKCQGVAKDFHLDELFYLHVLVCDDQTILIEKIEQGFSPTFAPSYLAFEQNLYQIAIKKALGYPLSLHLTKEKDYYATWLTPTELEKIRPQVPYFPEFTLYAPTNSEPAYLLITAPNLTEKLKKLKKIMG